MTDLSALLAILLGGLGSLVLWLLLGPIMTGYGFKKLVQRAVDGDEKAMQVFMNVGDLLIQWASTRQIKTGKKIKADSGELDADGKPILIEQEEVLTPITLLAQAVGTYAFQKVRSSAGGVKSQVGRMFQEELAASGQGLSPAALSALAKGKFGPALAEAALPFLLDKLKKRNLSQEGNTGSQGGWWNR